MINEKILVNYDHNQQFNNTPLNVVGANTNTTLRTITAGDDTDTKYVKMFGSDYAIGDITNAVIGTPRSDGGGTNKWWFEFYNENGTLLATVKDELGASTFVDGTAEASTKIYVKIVWKAGTVSITNADTIALTTDVDAPLTLFFAGESFTSGEIFISVSASGSTYYMRNQTDFDYKYGGERHTPDGTTKLPYFDPVSAVAVLGGAFFIVEVQDSEGYLIDSELDLNIAPMVLQASLGQTPIIIRTAGQSDYYMESTVMNNDNSVFFNENGNDSNSGKWNDPKKTINNVWLVSSVFVVYGGSGASVDSGIFTESLGTLIESDRIFSVEYGYKPKWEPSGSFGISFTTARKPAINNFSLIGNGGNAFYQSATINHTSAFNHSIRNCTFTNFDSAIFILFFTTSSWIGEWNIKNCLFDNCGRGIIINDISASTNSSIMNINNNVFKNISNRGIDFICNGADSVIENNNNFFYNCVTGAYCTNTAATDVSIDNSKNTFFNNTTSIEYNLGTISGVFTHSLDNCLFNNSLTVAINTDTNITINNNCFFNNALDTSGIGVVTNNNPVSADPIQCKITGEISGWRLGISGGSSCYRAGSDSDNIGARLRIIEINASTVEVNGFILKGGDFYSTAIYIVDTAEHIGTIIKWNTFEDFSGIIIDLYDDNVNLDSDIQLNNFNNSGAGITLKYGNNSILNNIFYRLDYECIYLDQSLHTIEKNVFFFGNYGLNTANTALSISFKNNIIVSFSLAINTIISMAVFFNCITDGVTASVDKSDASNINNNPLFRNTEIGSEDFNIKTLEAGDYRDSACKNAGSDGGDMGAYILDRSTAQDNWSSYPLEHNPRIIQFSTIMKGLNKFEKINGGLDLFGKDIRQMFIMKWTSRQFSTRVLREKIKYFSMRVKTRFNQIISDELIKLRISFLPTQSMLTGTNGDVNVSEKTLIDTAAAMVENEWKGWHVGIVYTSGTGLVIDATLKTATDSGAAWTVDQWIGYILYHNNNFYYVLSNTATALTLSDPNDTLSNTTINYTLERYFKIESNTATRFCLNNDDGLLVAALSADWYVRFIECIVQKPLIKFIQPRYFWQQETWKNGYQWIIEEY